MYSSFQSIYYTKLSNFFSLQWRYSVLVEGIGTLVDVVNTKPGNWTDVSVYTSDPFFPAAQAVMRNFRYASKPGKWTK